MHIMIASVDMTSFFHAMSFFSHMFSQSRLITGGGLSG